jgi:hypothetical protein
MLCKIFAFFLPSRKTITSLYVIWLILFVDDALTLIPIMFPFSSKLSL